MTVLQKLRIGTVLISLVIWIGMHPPANALWQAVPQHNPDGVLRAPPFAIESSVEIPVRTAIGEGLGVPEVTATSAVIVDLESGTILYAKNPDLAVPPASTTKIMSAMVAADNMLVDQNEDWITIQQSKEVIGQSLRLAQADSFLPFDMLRILLISSGNDAALALALNHPGGYSGFVKEMNDKADELGLISSSFKNPSGLPQEGHVSSARDMIVMARALLDYSWSIEIVSSPSAIVQGLSERQYLIYSTNQFLTQPGKFALNPLSQVKGIKTGWTEEAGECLLTLVEIDGKEVLLAVLGSEDRFGETAQLVNWVHEMHDWKEIELPQASLTEDQ